MSDKKMYDILGHFRNQNPELKKVEEAVKSEPVYEEVEARGSIMEAIKTLGEKFAMFKEAKAKPDFLDVDKDGNKKETFKKAVKDKEAKVEEGIEDRIAAAREKAAAAGKTIKDKEPTKSNVRKVAGKSYGGSAQHEPDEFKSRKTAILDKDEVDEGQGPYELYNPKHPKFKANYEKYKAKNPGCKLEDFIAAMKKREHGTVEEAGYSAKAARAGKDLGKPGKNFSKIAKGAAERYGSKAAGERVAGAVLNKLRHGEEMDEGTEPTEKVGSIIKRVLGNSLVWEPGHSKLYKNTRRSKTQRVDDYVMKYIQVNVNFPKGDYSLSANAGDQLAVDLKDELIQAGYPVHSDVQIFSDQIMFQTRTPITVTAEDLDEVSADTLKSYLGKNYRSQEEHQQNIEDTPFGSSKEWRDDAQRSADKLKQRRKGEVVAKHKLLKKGDLEEVAPPGAKAERMVKHIKKGYSKDGKLTPKEKSIAYATAWKAHNKGQVEEGTEEYGVYANGDTNKKCEFKGSKEEAMKKAKELTSEIPSQEKAKYKAGYTTLNRASYKAVKLKNVNEATEFKDAGKIKNSSTKFTKAKAAKLKESRMMEGEYDYEKVGRVLAKDRPGLDTNSSEFREAVYAELKKMGIPAKHAQYMLSYDPDFLGDAATSYGYFCKHQEDQMSESAPMFDDHDAMQELDEIARLAGLPTQQDEDMMAGCGDVGGGMEESMMDETCPSCDTAPCSCAHEEEMEMEGNEFSGALAKAKAAGAKDFEVGGKRYTVKEDATITVSATLEDDAIEMLRKLAGMVQDSTGLANSEISVPGPTPADLQAIETGPELEPVDAEAAPEVEVAEDGPNIVNAKPRKNSVLNTPREEYAASDITTKGGTGYDRNKKTYRGEWPGDNPMDAYGRDGTQVKEEALWKSYENMIETVKK